MRLPRPRISIRGLMVAIAVGTVIAWSGVRYGRASFYYAWGWWDAERELWAGKATVYTKGGTVEFTDARCDLDEATGLPFRALYGCVVGEGARERTQGHNDHLAQSIAWHGLPANSVKAWEDELFHLRECFNAYAPAYRPRRLTPGGPLSLSPDGKSSVRLLIYPRGDGQPGHYLNFSVASASGAYNFGPAENDGFTEVLWGPASWPFVVVRSCGGIHEFCGAYDRLNPGLLRGESWIEGLPRDDYLWYPPDDTVTPPAPPQETDTESPPPPGTQREPGEEGPSPAGRSSRRVALISSPVMKLASGRGTGRLVHGSRPADACAHRLPKQGCAGEPTAQSTGARVISEPRRSSGQADWQTQPHWSRGLSRSFALPVRPIDI